MASSTASPVVVAHMANAGYAQHLGVLWSSLASVHAPGRVRCVVFSDEPGAPGLRELEAFGRSLGLSAEVRPLDMARVPAGPVWRGDPAFRIAYARLVLPRLLDVPRVLYLDGDIVVRQDLTPLWEHDLGGAWVGAVPDGGTDLPWQALGLPCDTAYVNSGVLLMDLDAWRRHQVTEACERFVATSGHLTRFMDQCVINAVLHDHVARLDTRWNWMEHQPAARAERDPAIVHFAGRVKPWHYRSEHPWRHVYAEHLARTPWRGYRPPDRTLRRVLARALLPGPLRRGLRQLERRMRNRGPRVPTSAPPPPLP